MDDRVILNQEMITKPRQKNKSLSSDRCNTHKNLSMENQCFLDEVIMGLSQIPKTLPCKYFYDEYGSHLFEKICQLKEYYITRTELLLLEQIKKELAGLIGKNATIIEPGAGAGIKIRTLLKTLESPKTYVPLDISKDFLFYSAQVIQREFPQIDIDPIQGDFTQPVKWLDQQKNNNRVVFFPGSTIGNFEPEEAVCFLSNMHRLIGNEGALIIGVDLIKKTSILESAYNDSQGITAAFNKNLLTRINQQLNADFDLNQFSHKAIFNPQYQRIEMHLISQQTQMVKINGLPFSFTAGESIHTENSHKYSIESFLNMASKAQLKCVKSWQDDQQMISVHYLIRDSVNTRAKSLGRTSTST